ncbi:MAG: hypothetical protein JWM80_1631, partial [Cyanobacteria bacterium RYN_339]|nr:hypothetical protein [Cyanobacteria bacterium RYN_339]
MPQAGIPSDLDRQLAQIQSDALTLQAQYGTMTATFAPSTYAPATYAPAAYAPTS